MKDYAIIHNLKILLLLPISPLSKHLVKGNIWNLFKYFLVIFIGFLASIVFRFYLFQLNNVDGSVTSKALNSIFIYITIVLACSFLIFILVVKD
jgi:hypothetical protein